ncbi:MAG: hypothetical protein ACK5P7_07280 [Bdellovibrio sp.]|jgi:hypothetical protein
MKTLFVLAGLLTSTVSAHAGFQTLDHTCAETRQAVSSSGALLLSTGPYIRGYYVAHAGYCAVNQTTQPAWVETKDSDACFVGYTCSERDAGGSND